MATDQEIQKFILRIVEDRISFGGWVGFSHLETMDSLTGAKIHDKFVAYCQKHGCTITKKETGTVAPWEDFEAFLLRKFLLD